VSDAGKTTEDIVAQVKLDQMTQQNAALVEAVSTFRLRRREPA